MPDNVRPLPLPLIDNGHIEQSITTFNTHLHRALFIFRVRMANRIGGGFADHNESVVGQVWSETLRFGPSTNRGAEVGKLPRRAGEPLTRS